MHKTLLLHPNSKKENYQQLGQNIAAISPPYWMASRATELEKQGIAIKVIDAEVNSFIIKDLMDVNKIEIFPSGNHSSAYIQQKEGIDELVKNLSNYVPDIKVWNKIHNTSFESPSWKYFDMNKYRAHNWHCFGNLPREPYGLVCSSFGCPFKCSFCCINDFYGDGGYIERPLDIVMNEILDLRKNHNVKNIKFIDEMFLFHKKRIEKLCDMLISEDLGLNIWVYAKANIIPFELLPKLKKAGFNWLGIGVESGDENIRMNILKGQYTNNQFKETFNAIRTHGISISSAYIFGFQDDDHDTIQKTLDFAKELNTEQVNFHVMMLLPGSPAREEAIQMGWEVPTSWKQYSQYSYECLPSRTKYLTNSEVLRFRDNSFYDYYSSPKYLNMLREKFGQGTVDEILNTTKIKLPRKLYE